MRRKYNHNTLIVNHPIYTTNCGHFNFSFILDDLTGQWALSPAYDLTFSPGPGGEHSTTVAGEGRAPGNDHFVKLAELYGISAKELKEMVSAVAGAVERWPEFAEKAGVSEAKTNYIAGYLSGST